MFKQTQGLTERYPAQLIVPVFDFFAIVCACVIAFKFRFGTFDLHERYVLATALIALFAILLNSMFGGYSRWRTTPVSTLVARLLMVWVAVGLLATSLIFLADASVRFSRLWVASSLLLSYIIAAGGRVLAQIILRKARMKGRARRSIFLVGPSSQLLQVARSMRAAKGEGYSIVGVERLYSGFNEQSLPNIAARIEMSGAREVWICVPLEMGGAVRSIFYALRNHTAEVRFIPDFQGMQLLNHRFSEVAGHFAIDLSVTPLSGMARIIKRAEDLMVGSLITLLITPVCLLIAVAIKVTSPGPILFKQYRTGANGRRVKVYKFRSMRVHKEKEGQITQATKNDQRITPIGAFLRKTSLDELPQFYNVLQGRMSIVGPRPHALAHNDYYKDLVESYMRRHKVKPGITGWAQVNGLRGETDTLEKMERRVEYDLWYIDNWSLWLDLRIIILTVFTGFTNKNAY
ncbi:undecaprenyl-phosphate glucose phosphotransferase [Halomonas glaciei]|uniref:Undecaprenyl-phosphate glucose phosphotransferase n=1 Tax=Vreelandella glaciei TaxID=186761 RepID=A0A7Z0LTM8_9GAMM|nr:undecaprenyl-phosphate glucose phosphotransferase [Halomonas glaciei]NYS78440.1 undecaprenyl-phosphate glucose phosphotransferase [Halomonas glaciei]|tara:strand:+ start:3438 stop:4820 length:1383 start_codon:yes stop_codon:yes gene_type:complete